MRSDLLPGCNIVIQGSCSVPLSAKIKGLVKCSNNWREHQEPFPVTDSQQVWEGFRKWKKKHAKFCIFFMPSIFQRNHYFFTFPPRRGATIKMQKFVKVWFLSQRGVQHLAQTDLIFFWIKSQRVNCSQKHYGISIIDWFPLFPLKDFPEKFWLNLLQRCNFFSNLIFLFLFAEPCLAWPTTNLGAA